MNPEFLLNLSRVLAHTVVYEHNDVPEGVVNDFRAGIGFGTDIIGGLLAGKPNIPQFTPTDLGTEQSKAISENIASLPQAENLASQTNQFNINQIQSMLRQVIQGYDSMVGGVTRNINDELSGKIPADVSAAVQTSDAARALSGGFAGSGMHGNLVARDLGLTSLDLTQKGINTVQSWLMAMNSINAPGMFNLSNMFVSPMQQAQVTQQNNQGQFQRDYVSNMNDWQHSLGYYAGQDVMDTGATVMSMLSSFMGGMGGGGGGGGGGGKFSGSTGFMSGNSSFF